ncbi:hypothetical protein ACVIGB_010018 [Bradyrhizobium sp. USDA 4341]
MLSRKQIALCSVRSRSRPLRAARGCADTCFDRGVFVRALGDTDPNCLTRRLSIPPLPR